MKKPRSPQRRLLVFICILLGSLTPGLSLCPDGEETFLLGTSLRLLAPSYLHLRDLPFISCTEICRQDSHCRSLVFLRNGSLEECFLMEDNTATADIFNDTQLGQGAGTYYMEKACLRGACNRLFSAELLLGSLIDGYDDFTLTNVTRDFCLEACFSSTNFTCRSAEFDVTSSICRLSRYDRFNRHDKFFPSRDSVSASSFYFDNNCAYSDVTDEKKPEIILLGNVEHPFSITEYHSISLSECGDLCIRSKEFPCRSFLYGSRGKISYCGLTHQNRVGLLQNPGSFRTTQSLNYYEIVRDLIDCDESDVQFEMIYGHFLNVTPYKELEDLSARECLSYCREDEYCQSVNVDYQRNICRFNSETARNGVDNVLEEDLRAAYFEKSCLPAVSTCNRTWAFERLIGQELFSIDDKVLVSASTKEQCLVRCLQAKNPPCRAAEFNYQLNECRLLTINRFMASERGIRLDKAKFAVDYFENNCYSVPRGFCNTRPFPGHSYTVAQQELLTNSVDACRDACLETTEFICRSFSYSTNSKRCALSHLPHWATPSELVSISANTALEDVTQCFQVNVSCEPTQMRVSIRTNNLFDGKVYVKSRPHTCVNDVTRSSEFELPVSLGLTDCATENKEEGKFSNVIVIQNNDQILTSTDRAIGIHCTYETGNKTEYAFITVKGDINSSDPTRGRPNAPKLSLRILDLKGNDKSNVRLGEPLRVQIIVAEDSPYGIFVRNMLATDETGTSNLTLIDNKGCPVESRMMREMRKLDDKGKILESYMEAFTFTGSNTLRIETEVETCQNGCRPTTCKVATGRSEDGHDGSITSHGRRRRRTLPSDGPIVTLSKSIAIHSEAFGIGNPVKTFPITAPPPGEEKPKEEAYPNGIICLDSSSLIVAGGFYILIQVVIVVLSLVIACLKTRRHITKEDEILSSEEKQEKH